MKTLRSNLTRLRNLVEEKLPTGEDILGFPGVSKAMILSAIETAYDLSRQIEDDGSGIQFEIVSLKRFFSEQYSEVKNYLESDDEKRRSNYEFDKFLHRISSIVEKIKLVYFVVVKEGLRDDIELSKLRGQIAQHVETAKQICDLKDELVLLSEQIQEAKTAVDESEESIVSKAAKIEEWYGVSEKQYEEIDETHKAIQGWDQEIASRKVEIAAQEKRLSGIISEVDALSARLDKLVAGSENLAKGLNAQGDKNVSLLTEIENTLGDANRTGMSASFKERKNELKRPLFVWRLIFIMSLILLGMVAFYLILPEFATASPDWKLILVKLAATSPFIWLGWFSAKQYSFTAKILEDYAFKYASSMSYEGHKKATREVDVALERVLLEYSLFNMSQNPIRLYGKSDHATPLHDLAATILDRLPNLKRVTADTAAGKISADLAAGKGDDGNSV